MLRIAAIIFSACVLAAPFPVLAQLATPTARNAAPRTLPAEASGVKTPDPRAFLVETEVPASETALSTEILQISRVPIFSIGWLNPT
jgi:hypothetical protein